MKKTATLLLVTTFALAAAADEYKPSKLKHLQALRAKHIKQIDDTYIRELDKLKLEYTKRGDLDGANAINSALVKMMAKAGNEAPAEETLEDYMIIVPAQEYKDAGNDPNLQQEHADEYAKLVVPGRAWVEWEVKLPEGEYYLHILYASAAPRACHLEINGKEQEGEFLKGRTGSFNADGVAWVNCGKFTFKKGRNSILLNPIGVGPHYQELVLSKSENPPYEIGNKIR
ncbi:hypothetical protein [Pontiella sulfatireligans]|uniref:Uncharacterized protein n=1 Tax=Pontiella sulfatireligans TaxID=2750658 RepID=A0A6C2UNH9_9BACT|nr:hypothetical protein [Pontiella sulfatireligans]VGO21619.1 hypothetical protein SCARR_03693 [Pontiella sulfatireligans]